MSALIDTHPEIPRQLACAAIGLSRASDHRLRHPRPAPLPGKPRHSHRRLSDGERSGVLAVLHSERFADQPPAEVHAALLDEGKHLASIRTMYRLLAERGEQHERRAIRARQQHAVPRLSASAPNQVWTWDITALATETRGVFLYLYLVLDLFSRYVVGWMVAPRQNAGLAKILIATCATRHRIEPGQLTLHQDRGAPMTAQAFADLLAELSVGRSHSRPRTSDDNAFAEASFKTLKYQPDYPGRFRDKAHARAWLQAFVEWYCNHHHHWALALMTPADVFHGRIAERLAHRQQALDRAYTEHPERFARPPTAKAPPTTVYINPLPSSEAPTSNGRNEVLAT